jgi:hypothetical protein
MLVEAINRLLESIRAGVELGFDELPQYPEFHGFWALPNGKVILVKGLSEPSHVSTAKEIAETRGFTGEPYDFVMEELGWVRCVIESGILWVDLPSNGWKNNTQKRMCKDTALMYELKIERDEHGANG